MLFRSDDMIKTIDSNPLLDDRLRQMIYRDNALKLFPRLAAS